MFNAIHPITAKKILVAGGAGYIGSHVVLDLIESGYEVVVVDDLSNSNRESLRRVETLTGRSVSFYRVDIRNETVLARVFQRESPIDAVMHFAGLKAVGESKQQPLKYFDVNLIGTIRLLQVMETFECHNLIFSSSATVYGSSPPPYRESSPTGVGISNPYGRTKSMIEDMLWDMAQVPNSKWTFVSLRYFNPIGAHASGLLGEDPHGIPNNLMPYVAQVCVGRLKYLTVFGDDYDTPDGTGVRDYIHVVDLAKGHVAALNKIEKLQGFKVYNLGSGHGHSVLEVVHAMGRATGNPVPYKIGSRRPGDLAVFFAVPDKARSDLGWTAEKTLDDMCVDTWRWQKNNPNGYEDETQVPFFFE